VQVTAVHGSISELGSYFVVGLKSLRRNSTGEDVFPGDRVLVAGKRAGIVHFVGDTEFAPGLFVRCR